MRLAPRSYPRRFFRNLNYLAAPMKFSTPSSIGESTSQRLTFKRSYNKQQGTWQLWLKPRQNSRHLVQRRIALNTVEGSSVDRRQPREKNEKEEISAGITARAPAPGRPRAPRPRSRSWTRPRPRASPCPRPRPCRRHPPACAPRSLPVSDQPWI